MKNLMKVLCLVLVLMVVMAPVASFAEFSNLAQTVQGQSIGNVEQAATQIGGTVYNVIRTVAYIVALCMISYVAIQWFIAAPSKKAELKGRLWSLLIGAILLVCGATILDKVVDLGTTVVDNVQLQ